MPRINAELCADGVHEPTALQGERAPRAGDSREYLKLKPTSASWLNLVESRTGSRRAILRYLATWNDQAKPFRWTQSTPAIRRKLRRVEAIDETAH